MQKKFKEKYNDGCIKIFKLLQLLYEDKAYYKDVLAIFSGDEEKCTVTLNKFLNSLKVFGIKIKKVNGKYKMQNIPFSLKFSMDDLKSVNMLIKLKDNLPKGKTKNNIEDFIKNITRTFDDDTNRLFNEITLNKDYSFYYANVREQIEICEKFCEEKYKINIKYYKENHELSAFCIPQKVIYDNRSAYLRVLKIKENIYEDIPTTDIISAEQVGKTEFSTVVYKIKGRLAQAYILKDNEELQKVFPDGSKIIVNRNEPPNKLLKRLARYDFDCVIQSPKVLRDMMKELINDTLKNYEE